MAFLKLHHQRKKSDARIRKLKEKLELSRNLARQLEEAIDARMRDQNQTFRDLVVADKRAALAKMAAIEPSLDEAWKFKRFDDDELMPCSCLSKKCKDGGFFYCNHRFFCIFDIYRDHQFCHTCFNGRDFDVEFFTNKTKQLKEEYLAVKNARPYMQATATTTTVEDDPQSPLWAPSPDFSQA